MGMAGEECVGGVTPMDWENGAINGIGSDAGLGATGADFRAISGVSSDAGLCFSL
jgi:hypothetical protein